MRRKANENEKNRRCDRLGVSLHTGVLPLPSSQQYAALFSIISHSSRKGHIAGSLYSFEQVGGIVLRLLDCLINSSIIIGILLGSQAWEHLLCGSIGEKGLCSHSGDTLYGRWGASLIALPYKAKLNKAGFIPVEDH